ncbi:hypothetical protein [Nitrincola alkalilacustris]|uniref:hypothetical protein n=1 Tax=Nitrincola alkalilacustris TaxID=1571224 RepID=UPI00124D5AFE|nr:hypothetical protein [Nitrincola alkalilacustris]
MKSQDVVLLLKLISLQKRESVCVHGSGSRKAWPDDWQDWDDEMDGRHTPVAMHSLSEIQEQAYSVRNLEHETGISKSQVSASLKRCLDVGLAIRDRKTGLPRANTKALFEFLVYGIRYVFPARAGELARGIGTSFAAPVLEGKLMTGGDLVPVWPDAQGNRKGLSVTPLYHSVPNAVRRDPELYALLALVDAIRLGNPREANLAADMLKNHMEVRA